MLNKQIRLARDISGFPRESDFYLVEEGLPELMDGQALCRAKYLSLDPYMRSQIAGKHLQGAVAVDDVMRGETISEVVASKEPALPVGSLVRCMGDWQTYSIQQAQSVQPVPAGVPAHFALSVLGMPGLTAYAALIWLARIQPGELVVIPGAAGAIGSIAGQLAKKRGCTVIGIAGCNMKCDLAVSQLGYDACINRRQENVASRLSELAPNGVDVYFDLVGGDMLHTISQQLALHARIVLCGLSSELHLPHRSPGPPSALWIKARATVMGLVVYDFETRRQEFIEQCLPAIRAGDFYLPVDLSYGLEQAPAAFCRMLAGNTIGKTLIKV